MEWVIRILCLFIGGFLGLMVCALCTTAKRADEGAEWAYLLDLLLGVVEQGCDYDGELDSMAIGVYGEALEVLEDYGLVEVDKRSGRRVIARRREEAE